MNNSIKETAKIDGGVRYLISILAGMFGKTKKNMKIKIIESIKNIFKVDPTIGVSKFRIYLLRFFYLINVVLLGIAVWTEIFTHKGLWEPLPGVAFSFGRHSLH